ncbi:MAG: transcriptional regulator [archaeon GB-1867-005]|nr:transcriptional regulator [Candidatus Culexmicrobium cathedralense]
MQKDAIIGAGLLAGSIIGIIIYIWLLFFPTWPGLDLIVMKLTALIAVGGVLTIIAWIGYTLATTPPPKPIEEIEKEIEEELKKLEEETKEEETKEEKPKEEKKETKTKEETKQ